MKEGKCGTALIAYRSLRSSPFRFCLYVEYVRIDGSRESGVEEGD